MSVAIQAAAAAVLTCEGVDIAAGGRTLVSGLALRITAGDRVCVLGRNGAGKTTLLHALADLAPPAGGRICLDSVPLAAVPRRRRARRLGLVTQTTEDPFPATVLEMALIGRHPHLSFWAWEDDADQEKAVQALHEVGLEQLADRRIDTLSGGERRRLAIATALCQDPQVLLLDEPLNHLDPQHQMDVMAVFEARSRAGAAVVASLHDLNIAARFADTALLLFGPEEDGRWLFGAAADILQPEPLTRLYRAPVRVIDDDGRRVFVTG